VPIKPDPPSPRPDAPAPDRPPAGQSGRERGARNALVLILIWLALLVVSLFYLF